MHSQELLACVRLAVQTMKVMPSSPYTVKICLAPYDGLTPSMCFLYLEVQKKGIHWTEVTEVINWTRAIVFHIYWVYYIEDIMRCIHTYIQIPLDF